MSENNNDGRWDSPNTDFVEDLNNFIKMVETPGKFSPEDNQIFPPWIMGPHEYNLFKENGHIKIIDGQEVIFGRPVVHISNDNIKKANRMSWGERSCLKPCRNPGNCNISMCNVSCEGYKWDGTTKPDSVIMKNLNSKKAGVDITNLTKIIDTHKLKVKKIKRRRLHGGK